MLWKDLGKKFFIIYFIGLLIIILLPVLRYNPFSYIGVFLIAFSVSFFFIFFRAKEKPPELMTGDR